VSSQSVRVFLFLLLVAGVATAVWYHQVLDRERTIATQEVEQLAALRDTVNVAITRARSAQQAYLAPGQGVSYWSTEFAEALAEIAGALEGLRATEEEHGGPSGSLEAADRAFRVYEGLDRKVRGFVQAGNLMMAADVVYEDSVKTSSLIASSVGDAYDALARPAAATADEAALQQQWLAAGAVGGGLLVSLLLVPRGRTRRAHDEPRAASASADADDDLLLTAREREVVTTPVPTPPPASSVPPVALQPAGAAAGDDPSYRTALTSTAVVCTDLGRVKDGEQLRAVLGRAAGVLDASGVIVWVADASGRQLRPVFAYGYPEEALRRIPALPRSADNATAMAWREARPQVVDATDTAPGAIAVPLLGPQGCTGVLAAEIEHGREASPHTRAVAEILAAQLAVLIPPETPAPVAPGAEG
jgi:hypothetical protein